MKLHLGCGKKNLEGFINVDLLDYDHIDYQTSIDNLHFAEDSSVDLIYACHVLEHVGRYEYEKTLNEWYRVLKPSGVLRLAVPDFEACVKYYSDTGEIMDILGLLVGGQNDKYDYHNMLFDEKLLIRTLKDIGFDNIYRYDWKNTTHKNMDDYSQAYIPHMDKENGLLMSLNIEAVK